MMRCDFPRKTQTFDVVLYVYGLEYGAAAVMCHQEAAKVGNDIPVRND